MVGYAIVFVSRTLVRTWGNRVDPLRRGTLEGQACGIPHLAKNERDVGHPAWVEGIEATGRAIRLPDRSTRPCGLARKQPTIPAGASSESLQ
jgi:hypothetical protein